MRRHAKHTEGPLGARLSRRSLAGLVTGAAAAAGGLIAASPAHAAFTTGTWYLLQSRHSGLFMDIAGSSTSNGAM
ncbi:RICIN domain-containing protein, partial [Glycomyces sp. L485]